MQLVKQPHMTQLNTAIFCSQTTRRIWRSSTLPVNAARKPAAYDAVKQYHLMQLVRLFQPANLVITATDTRFYDGDEHFRSLDNTSPGFPAGLNELGRGGGGGCKRNINSSFTSSHHICSIGPRLPGAATASEKRSQADGKIFLRLTDLEPPTMRVWISILLFVLSFEKCEGCSCAYPGPTEKGLMCDADFIIKTRVKSELRAPQDEDEFNYFYRIRRPRKRHIYKLENDAQLTKKSFRRVYTASNGGLCGMYLQNGQTYIIAGRVVGSSLKIALCSAYTERLPMSLDTRKLLIQFRKNKVDCSTGVSAGGPKAILENNAQLTDTSLRRVYTASNGGLCGMYLQKGQRYLIAGRVSGSKLHIALCSAYTERLPLSSDTRKLLFQFRKNKVDCSTGLSAGRPKT
ncbi:hypothetical protein MAR_023233, partial [Mya arenaria]